MPLNICAHCGSPDTMVLVDNFQCLACGFLTRITDGTPVDRPDRHEAPSPAAQRTMHAPGGNDGVHRESLQVGSASWPERVDPAEKIVKGEPDGR